jgi:hypothetical protein
MLLVNFLLLTFYPLPRCFPFACTEASEIAMSFVHSSSFFYSMGRSNIHVPPPSQPGGEALGTCVHHPTPRFPNDPPPIPLPPHPGRLSHDTSPSVRSGNDCLLITTFMKTTSAPWPTDAKIVIGMALSAHLQ